MEKKEWIEGCKRVLTKLVKDTLWEDFRFPEGGSVDRQLESCFDKLSLSLCISYNRLVDFCVCQVSSMSDYDRKYRFRWNITHSFGDKAISRYMNYSTRMRAHDDKWLSSFGASRSKYVSMIEDCSKHPLAIFIYPEYEEHTKRRWMSNELGYLICGTSTLMWTPFSLVCQKCTNAPLCEKRTAHVHHELYRIRCEAWRKQQKE